MVAQRHGGGRSTWDKNGLGEARQQAKKEMRERSVTKCGKLGGLEVVMWEVVSER